MITVSKQQMNAVEYLIEQSEKGNHVLFEPEWIRKSLSGTPESLSDQDLKAIENQLELLLSLPGIMEQKKFIASLSSRDRARMIRTYFNIIENTIFDREQPLH